jgi:hypothetical protein
MVPLNDFRVKGKADVLLVAKVIAPKTMAHIRILVGLIIFCCLVNSFFSGFTSTKKQLLSHSGRMAGLVDWEWMYVKNVGTLAQNEYYSSSHRD